MKFSWQVQMWKAGIGTTITGILLLVILIHTPFAVASTGPQGPCGNWIVVDNTPPGASANCDMTIAATFSAGTLSFINDATATTSQIVVGSNTFSFHTTVIDQRNTNAGWRLEAASAGMHNSVNNVTTTVPVGFTGSSATCTPTVPGQDTCVTPIGYSIGQLTTSPQYFLSTGPGGSVISGTFHATTTGTYTFTGSEPAGTYTGLINISLVNAF